MDKIEIHRDGARPRIGVVVLNYFNFGVTIECVTSLLSLEPSPELIVIVDNLSPNESLKILNNSFRANDTVMVVSSKKNGGYSYGNNFGIRILRERGVDAVIIATSDTKVRDTDLLLRFQAAMSKEIGIIGPRIIENGRDINPSRKAITFKYALDMLWMQLGMPGYRLRKILAIYMRKLLTRSPRAKIAGSEGSNANIADAVEEVYMLHGSFLCITEQYFQRCGLLDEDIFMYGEEDLLAWSCRSAGLKQVYLKSTKVEHEGDATLNVVTGDDSGARLEALTKQSARILRKKISVVQLLTKASLSMPKSTK